MTKPVAPVTITRADADNEIEQLLAIYCSMFEQAGVEPLPDGEARDQVAGRNG